MRPLDLRLPVMERHRRDLKQRCGVVIFVGGKGHFGVIHILHPLLRCWHLKTNPSLNFISIPAGVDLNYSIF